MKNLKLIGFLMIFASSLMFIQCTSDPIAGPQGIAGADGIDGIDGINGVDGLDSTAECVACHSETHRSPINTAYEMSGHYNESYTWSGDRLSEYANRGKGSGDLSGDCAACHTNEGYIDQMTSGSIAIDPYPQANVVSCTTCHSSHKTFDFENDGADYALRNIDGIDLMIGSSTDNVSGTIDFEGTSNNCAFCHQPRKLRPTEYGDIIDGMFNVPPHYGPHYGAQTTMLEGIQGEHFAGAEAYPVAGTSTHRTGQNGVESSCVSCHMGSPDQTDGEHTFAPTLNTCTQCHSSATSFDHRGVQTEVTDLLHDIEALLITEGILSDSGSLITGDQPIDLARAYWNWEYVHQDGSHGIHNPKYTKALLKNTKAYLEALQP